jgi:predicted amidophosphoribosyltransferase
MCAVCGAQFTLSCPKCGATVSARDTVCPNCGETFD